MVMPSSSCCANKILLQPSWPATALSSFCSKPAPRASLRTIRQPAFELCQSSAGGLRRHKLGQNVLAKAGPATSEGTPSGKGFLSWGGFFLPTLVYSTKLEDADPEQLSKLWERTLGVRRDPHRIAVALDNSFAVVVVLAADSRLSVLSPDGETRPRMRVVGIGRAVSDGEFMASICDVAVDPELQRRGIGRKIVKRLLQTRGPTGFVAFCEPRSRNFFFKLGFRGDRKYRLMAFRSEAPSRASSASVDNPRLQTSLEAGNKGLQPSVPIVAQEGMTRPELF